MIRATAIVALLTLTACEETTQAVDDVARRSAKAAVAETLVTRFPAVPKQAVTPFTDCIIDNASAREIGEFAKDAVIGVSETTVALVRSVLERPETQSCVVQAWCHCPGATDMKLTLPWRRTKKRDVEPAPFQSAQYWSERYESGRTSGSGSYGRLADYKAGVINDLVKDQVIGSVCELGSGDGNQTSLFEIENYTGVDVSPLVVERANERFSDRSGWHFSQADAFLIQPRSFDMTMSLDVIYHLVEDDVFDRYMRDLTTLADRFVLIYASDHDEQPASVHVRHRAYGAWMAKHAPEFTLVKTYEQPYPMTEDADVDQTSFAFFRLFQRHVEAE